jgi:drug/metabolite transporter (DMT)-like permease
MLAKYKGILAVTIAQSDPSLIHYLKTILLCFACSLGLVFYLGSIKTTPVSISVALSSINIFSILTAVFILREEFKNIYWCSFSLAALGVWLVKSEKSAYRWTWNWGATAAILAAFFWGVTYALLKYPAKWIGALPAGLILETTVIITAFIWNRFTAKAIDSIYVKMNSSRLQHYLVLAVLLIGALLFFNLAIQRLDVLLLNLSGNFTLIVSVVLGMFWQQEKIRNIQLLGMILILISLLITQLF